MDKSRLKFSMFESLLVVTLFGILLAYAIQLHRQEFAYPTGLFRKD